MRPKPPQTFRRHALRVASVCAAVLTFAAGCSHIGKLAPLSQTIAPADTTGGNNPGLLLTSPGSAITIHDVEQVKFDDVTAFVGTDGSGGDGGDEVQRQANERCIECKFREWHTCC